MLMIGVALRNIPYVNTVTIIDSSVIFSLRQAAFTVVLLTAGLGLDLSALLRLKIVCIRLTFLPCIAETITVATAAFLIMGMNYLHGLILGCVLGAVSPAVIIPCLMVLQAKNLGVQQGIPTLIIAASSVDDVVAITGFSVCLGIAFSTGGILMAILRSPLEILLSLLYGVVSGWMLWFLPDSHHSNTTFYRVILLLMTGFLAMFGSQAIGAPGAGALACITLALIARIGWSRATIGNADKNCCQEDSDSVSQALNRTWTMFAQPLLFGLTGVELDIDKMEVAIIGTGLAVLCIGLIIRVAVTFLAASWSEFTVKERLFIAIAWLPKATVQAALGPVMLDTARSVGASSTIQNTGLIILTLAVLSILITAPLGAIGIVLSGPHLLHGASSRSQAVAVEENDADLDGATDPLTHTTSTITVPNFAV